VKKNTLTKPDEIKRAFMERSLVFNQKRIEITDHFNQASTIIRCDKFVNEIVEWNGALFSIEGAPDQKTIVFKNPEICDEIEKFFKKDMISAMIKSFESYRFNPHIEICISNSKATQKKIELNMALNNDEHVTNKVDLFNEFVDNIRSEVASKSFKKIIAEYQRLQSKNNKSLVDFLDHILKREERMFVVKEYFSYKTELYNHILNMDERNHLYYQAKYDRQLLFKKMRTHPLFEHLVGFVWKLEYNPDQGFRYNLLFLFDGKKFQQHVDIAMLIGELWTTEITGGRGLYFACNSYKDYYHHLGCGMINCQNSNLWEELQKTADYFTLPDYYARLIVPDNGCIFDKCEFKSKYRT
jgi:Inovirus Gp2